MNRELWEDWLNYDARADLKAFQTVPTEKWVQLGEQHALQTFRTAAERVPAYRDFLAKNGVNPQTVRTIEDFRQLPLTDKASYFDNHSLSEVCVDGSLREAATIHGSSGSSGRGYYWPKTGVQDINACKGMVLLYVQYFDIDKFSSLVINCFSLGPWAAGEMVHSSAKAMGDKGLNVAVISAGLDADRFFTILSDLGGSFDQIIVGAYPSFFSYLASEAERRGVDFRDFKIGLVTGGERFSETWRRRMTRVFGFRRPYRDVASVLGTSETGLTGFSTPFSDALRIYLSDQGDVAKSLVGDVELPSIIQFIPPARYVEIVDGQIVVTCSGLVPLIRHNTQDVGQMFTPRELLACLPDFLDRFTALADSCGIPNLPVLAVQGRADALTILAINVFHNQLCSCIEAPELAEFLTGRFVAEEIETETADKHLRLLVELRSGVDHRDGLADEVTRLIAKNLATVNSEYAVALSTLGESVHPLVELVSAGSRDFLPSGKGSAIRRRLSNQLGGAS
jgi:phenylacetate-CoA ligase